jgi:hypothetical protein
LGGRGRRISEFEAGLFYRVSSRTARATQRNPVSGKKKERERESQRMRSQTEWAVSITLAFGESESGTWQA